MMNKIYFLAILFLFSLCSQRRSSLEIKIQSVNKDLESPIRIGCGDFSNIFKDEIKARTINDKEQIEVFNEALKKLDKDRDSMNVDVRAKIFIRDNDHVDTLCASRFFIIYNDITYKMSNELASQLWSGYPEE